MFLQVFHMSIVNMFFSYFYFPFYCISLHSFVEGYNIYVVVFGSNHDYEVANVWMLGSAILNFKT
jgi:hypothetical protein